MASKTTHQTVTYSFDVEKTTKDIITKLVRDERQRAFSCERSQIVQLDKAVCQLQKVIKSIEVRMNRMESENAEA